MKKKYMVLGVAFDWSKRKGLDVMIELSQRLGQEYQIVLVGIDAAVDKALPDNIIYIHRTYDQTELAEIYTAADVFVNPTREENYPTVNMEALACGTPVITFQTGGSPEIIDEKCGAVVACDNIAELVQEITEACETERFTQGDCTGRAKNFSASERMKGYLELYRSTCKF